MVSYIKHRKYNETTSGLPLYEFQLDNAAEVAELPTTENKKEYEERVCAGSVAYTADLNKAYILSPSGVWTDATV